MDQDSHNPSPTSAVWPPAPTNFASSASQTSPLDYFRVQNVWLVLFLSIITLGIYGVFWLNRQNKALGMARADLKVSPIYGNIVLAFIFLSVGLDIASGFNDAQALDTTSKGLSRIVGIMILILALQVRSGFNSLLQARKGDAIWFSGLYTWLLSVVYLQYKLNKIIQRRQTELHTPPIG